MSTQPTLNLAYQITTVLAAISLVVGVLASAKLGYNLFRSPDVYPYGGVLPDVGLSSANQPPFYQKEIDCQYSQVYYDERGEARQATETEQKLNNENMKRCLDSVSFMREQAKEQDITVAAFFTLGGLGLLIARQILMRN
jgi:hypothetical protein